jgi:hypothetical protein
METLLFILAILALSCFRKNSYLLFLCGVYSVSAVCLIELLFDLFHIKNSIVEIVLFCLTFSAMIVMIIGVGKMRFILSQIQQESIDDKF